MNKRLAVVDQTLCKPDQCQLECIQVCPVNKLNQECIVLSDERKLALISAPLCTGCGLCIKKCPFHAISIVNLVAPVEDKLVFSYGDNSFKLYGLALPEKGVFGVLGDNGCGKSTNVKLLEGKLKPQKLAVKEWQRFFEQKFGLVVKPQELVSANLGRVGDLMNKIGGPRLAEIKVALDLDDLKDRDLSQLSGGELQRVMVAAALMRQKDAYLLDEPFAFLDYAYRIRLVEYLRQRFTEQKVILVDHDLSLLSYACDQTYILFGEPGVYGIVSQPYATDRAIHMFLEGFLEGENVRFREEPVRFKPPLHEIKTTPNVTLPAALIERGSTFSVQNPTDVTLNAGEIVGLVGRNGTGKSTLAAHFSQQLGGSLKPQLLDRSDDLVLGVLREDTPFQQRFIRDMAIKKLEFFTFQQLSGGELQKVRIFEALAQPTNLYVVDEPTNMMDVRGRVALSRLLREKAKEGASVLLIDHDLEFVLNTVDRLMLIEGIPSKKGHVAGVFEKQDGITRLLSDFDLTYRRDSKTDRLKLNKAGSQKHMKLKESGKYVE